MPSLRRGFETEANEIAREVRSELGLGHVAPLDPRRLAAHLEVPIWGLDALGKLCPGALAHFKITDPSAFSAITVFRGTARVIVHNDSHSPGRESSNLATRASSGLAPPHARAGAG